MITRAVWVSVLLMLVALPLILGRVPRNRFYGFRTRYTLSSDPVWYHANRVSGVALFVAGAAWLAVALLLPPRMADEAEAARWVTGLGLGALAAAVLLSVWLVNRGR